MDLYMLVMIQESMAVLTCYMQFLPTALSFDTRLMSMSFDLHSVLSLQSPA